MKAAAGTGPSALPMCCGSPRVRSSEDAAVALGASDAVGAGGALGAFGTQGFFQLPPGLLETSSGGFLNENCCFFPFHLVFSLLGRRSSWCASGWTPAVSVGTVREISPVPGYCRTLRGASLCLFTFPPSEVSPGGVLSSAKSWLKEKPRKGFDGAELGASTARGRRGADPRCPSALWPCDAGPPGYSPVASWWVFFSSVSPARGRGGVTESVKRLQRSRFASCPCRRARRSAGGCRAAWGSLRAVGWTQWDAEILLSQPTEQEEGDAWVRPWDLQFLSPYSPAAVRPPLSTPVIFFLFNFKKNPPARRQKPSRFANRHFFYPGRSARSGSPQGSGRLLPSA